MKKEKSCGAVIARYHEGELQVLAIHQVQGHWCFPKGHVEGNETEKETAAREIREETGLEVTFEKDFRETTEYSPEPGVIKEVVYFLAYPNGGIPQVQKEEVSEMAWVNQLQASALITYDNDADLMHKAFAYIKKHTPSKWDEE